MHTLKGLICLIFIDSDVILLETNDWYPSKLVTCTVHLTFTSTEGNGRCMLQKGLDCVQPRVYLADLLLILTDRGKIPWAAWYDGFVVKEKHCKKCWNKTSAEWSLTMQYNFNLIKYRSKCTNFDFPKINEPCIFRSCDRSFFYVDITCTIPPIHLTLTSISGRCSVY